MVDPDNKQLAGNYKILVTILSRWSSLYEVTNYYQVKVYSSSLETGGRKKEISF